MADIPNYWFPAKRHGWGWSYPRTWQGWVVVAVYLALVAAVHLLDPAEEAGLDERALLQGS